METLTPRGALRLSLHDFICEKTVEKLKEFQSPELVISPEKLCDYFVEALEQARDEETDNNVDDQNTDAVSTHDIAIRPPQVIPESPASQGAQETATVQLPQSPAADRLSVWKEFLLWEKLVYENGM
ncbi:hypothetical protein F4813DRAFT_391470 [Daldinia decipiens]|uniref:uncharacterized protein n=1 Tax=Daldinia decipiens TaxID=326647 RepID=UPI0020C3F1BD|nr:uncharacterized protein F4813DRAFT_391470 [Daldinia decipiens]KAI1655621.1 hypothetical protein F4813DRAFT_391470 [Daldinia decipiens]